MTSKRTSKLPKLILLCFVGAQMAALADHRACAQSEPPADLPQAMNLAQMKFQPAFNDPTTGCEISILRGDLAKGPSVFAYRSGAKACIVPPHWHPSAEWLVVVSGAATFANKGEQPLRLIQGGFFFQPAHKIAGGHFEAGTLMFISFEGSADTHWVDKNGKEISYAEAFRDLRPNPKAD